MHPNNITEAIPVFCFTQLHCRERDAERLRTIMHRLHTAPGNPLAGEDEWVPPACALVALGQALSQAGCLVVYSEVGSR